MKKVVTLILFLSAIQLIGQPLNLKLLSHVDFPEGCNDIWGYVDDNGTEYAILGTRDSTVIFSLEDPSAPIRRFAVVGANSVWRDFKSFGNFVYGVADQGNDGLLIVDMSGAPEQIASKYWNPTLDFFGAREQIEACHNLYIDEKGYCYLAGCRPGVGGILIFDIFTDPENPKFISAANTNYAHDVVVKNDVMVTSEIYAGQFTIFDVKDKNNLISLSSTRTTSSFTHNAWMSDDLSIVYTTDERANSNLDAYDITDLENPVRLGIFYPNETRGNNVVPHNTHFIDGYNVVSWYTDGLIIVDSKYPDNMVMVGRYDTWLRRHGGTNGCWGAYPYLPSGIVLASDIATGMYIFEPTYARAAYVEGKVTDSLSTEPVIGVDVTLMSPIASNKKTNVFGVYKAGYHEAGQYTIRFSHQDYFSKEIMVDMENDKITVGDVQLVRKPSAQTTVIVVNERGIPVENAGVFIQSDSRNVEGQTDANGVFAYNTIISQEDHTIYVGKWGYHQNLKYIGNISSAMSHTLEIAKGYKDDFLLDLGWTIESDAIAGIWTRDEPVAVSFNGGPSVTPEEDLVNDLGDYCYITGNSSDQGGVDDVDNGYTRIISPAINLSNAGKPVLRFSAWFFNDLGQGTPNDEISVQLSDGLTTTEILSIGESKDEWVDYEINLNDFLGKKKDNLKIIVEVSDQGEQHIVYAAFDGFEIEDENPLSTSNTESSGFSLMARPNTFDNTTEVLWSVKAASGNLILEVLNSQGQQVTSNTLRGDRGKLIIGEAFEPGLYFLRLRSASSESAVIRLIKI